MAQVQQTSFSISVAIDSVGQIDLGTFDQRVNTALANNQQRGFDLVSAVYVPGGSLPPHIRLFFVRQ